MSDVKLIEEIAAKFSALLATSPAHDIEKNLRAFAAGALTRLDVVSREEFEIQRELLVRARDRIVALERRIDELERRSVG